MEEIDFVVEAGSGDFIEDVTAGSQGGADEGLPKDLIVYTGPMLAVERIFVLMDKSDGLAALSATDPRGSDRGFSEGVVELPPGAYRNVLLVVFTTHFGADRLRLILIIFREKISYDS